MQGTSELRYKNHVRITSGSYVTFMFGNYIIKPCKGEQKIRNNYVKAYNVQLISRKKAQLEAW